MGQIDTGYGVPTCPFRSVLGVRRQAVRTLVGGTASRPVRYGSGVARAAAPAIHTRPGVEL